MGAFLHRLRPLSRLFFWLDRNNETDRDVEFVPRPHVDYSCHECQETLCGQQVAQCPSSTFCIHSNCLRDVNNRNDELFCPLCNRRLSPTRWYEHYIRYHQYYGEAVSLPNEAR